MGSFGSYSDIRSISCIGHWFRAKLGTAGKDAATTNHLCKLFADTLWLNHNISLNSTAAAANIRGRLAISHVTTRPHATVAANAIAIIAVGGLVIRLTIERFAATVTVINTIVVGSTAGYIAAGTAATVDTVNSVAAVLNIIIKFVDVLENGVGVGVGPVAASTTVVITIIIITIVIVMDALVSGTGRGAAKLHCSEVKRYWRATWSEGSGWSTRNRCSGEFH